MAPISIEAFPIVVRSTAVGLFGCFSTINSILGASIAGVIMQSTEDNFAFVCVFSVSTIVSGISAMLVLETKNFDPDTYFSLTWN